MARDSSSPALRPSRLARLLGLALLAGSFAGAPVMAAEQASLGSARQLDGSYWQDAGKPLGRTANATNAALSKWRALKLDTNGVRSVAAQAPMEFTSAAQVSPATISLPHPNGGLSLIHI